MPNLYIDIIEPLGYQAKEKSEEFKIEYGNVINKFSLEFISRFCDTEGNILWEDIVKFGSLATPAK